MSCLKTAALRRLRQLTMGAVFSSLGAVLTVSTANADDRYLLQFAPHVGVQQQQLLRQWYGVEQHQTLDNLGLNIWQLSAEQASRVAQDPAFVFIEPDHQRQPNASVNDPAFNRQWALLNDGSFVADQTALAGADIQVTEAWDFSRGDKSVVVAILDDGVDIHHPDLAANIWRNPLEIAGNGQDDDNNGLVDDVHGWNFADNNAQIGHNGPTMGHGTQLAGIIGATGNNHTGISGVAQQVSLMVLKFDYSVSAELRAIDYAIAQGVDVVNMSFSSAIPSNAERTALLKLQEHGILVVTSAGNDRLDNRYSPKYPASYGLDNVLAVSGSDTRDILAVDTDFSPTQVDIAAPGKVVYTTFGEGGQHGRGYGFANGTSYAAAVVSGIAAITKAYYPELDHAGLRARIVHGAEYLPSMQGRLISSGRANALNTLTEAPRPLLIASGVSINDNGNHRLDPNESTTLAIQLRNLWLPAENVRVSLVSSDTQAIRVLNSSIQLGDIPASGTRLLQFPIRVGPATNHHRQISLRLDIEANGEHQARYLDLEIGKLESQAVLSGQLQQDAQDSLHLFHIDVPAGTQSLVLSAKASGNVDLVARRNNLPDFVVVSGSNHTINANSSSTMVANSASGSEQLIIESPREGTWYVGVFNSGGSQNIDYEISAELNADLSSARGASESSGGGGGGSLSGILVVLFACLTMARRRRL